MAESTFLKYGQRVRAPSEYPLFRAGRPTEDMSVYYLVAGLIRLDMPRGDDNQPFPYYVHPGSVIGLPESLLNTPHPAGAVVKERSLLYRWDLVSFFMAVDVSIDLAQRTFVGLSQLLRVLNAEAGASDGE